MTSHDLDLIFVIVVVVGLIAFGGYLYGWHVGNRQGFRDGFEAGLKYAGMPPAQAASLTALGDAISGRG